MSVLNLAYRQGPDLPQLKHGFADSHFICFPYETRRTGIYAAGPTRRPMDLAAGHRGRDRRRAEGDPGAGERRPSAAPRTRAAWDLSFPIGAPRRLHPVQALHRGMPVRRDRRGREALPEVFNEEPLPPLRHLHGRLSGARDLLRELLGATPSARRSRPSISPTSSPEKPRILLLACENDAYPALDMAGTAAPAAYFGLRARDPGALPRFGEHHLDHRCAERSGYDGVMMMGCKKGDDYQCHFVKGSEMAFYRMGKIDDTLEAAQPRDRARRQTLEVAITDIERVPKLIDEYVDQIKAIGLSPMKGFG
jgi:quinone-modifying oxidoreductase subunit QmoB